MENFNKEIEKQELFIKDMEEKFRAETDPVIQYSINNIIDSTLHVLDQLKEANKNIASLS